MVWIHGGAFMLGSGYTDFYGPEHLLEHDVVLVTLSYRVGALGFLSTGDEVIPGNAGLKDQVMALKWVKSNIANFGGDPQNVTIFGESAGAVSCHLLQISPAAKGLFHKVICQSGVASLELVSAPVKDRTLRLAQSLGFTGDSSEELLAFMRNQPVQTLVESVLNCLTKEENQRMETLVPLAPTIEPDSVKDAIITRSPMEILKSGKFNKVLTILGVCSREGILFIRELTKNKGTMRELNTNFQRLLPADIPDKREEHITVALDIKRFYFKNQPLEDSTVEMYGDLRGDLFFVHPSLVAARVQYAVAGAQPVNPTPVPEDPILSVTWTPFKKENRCYLNITKDGLSVERDLYKERMDFWDKLYRQ
ncbi:juvenile hormone esterase-like [Schistocerca serialis cubense]|uniref:juvenile hormone esterase-like n=1 Tax=Schistocerca serialis cubense TaxID=2023355 RepID=UPI00214E3103|nr:juvenile hormone esterase-like [Schistocerca serialis cubense]